MTYIGGTLIGPCLTLASFSFAMLKFFPARYREAAREARRDYDRLKLERQAERISLHLSLISAYFFALSFMCTLQILMGSHGSVFWLDLSLIGKVVCILDIIIPISFIVGILCMVVYSLITFRKKEE